MLADPGQGAPGDRFLDGLEERSDVGRIRVGKDEQVSVTGHEAVSPEIAAVLLESPSRGLGEPPVQGGEGTALVDHVQDGQAADPLEGLAEEQRRELLGRLINGLPPRVSALLAEEAAWGVDTPRPYLAFAARVGQIKSALRMLLGNFKAAGLRIAAYGASAKGSTLLNYCGIRTDFLEYTVDRNPYKHGRFLPGTHIPIYPPSKIDETRPDYGLILPWNLKKEIVAQMRHVGAWGARFVAPIPEVHVIDPGPVGGEQA